MNKKTNTKYYVAGAIFAILVSYFIAKNTININRLTVAVEEERSCNSKEVVVNIDYETLKDLGLTRVA